MYKLGLNFEHVIVSSKETGSSVLDTLKKFKMYGVSSVDIFADKIIGDPFGFKKDLLVAGVNVDCVFFMADFGHDANIGYALSVIDYCAENNVKQIMLLTKGFEETDNLNDYFSLLKKNLRRVVKYASNFGVKIGIENFGKENSPFSTVERVLDLLKSVKDLGLVYDSGNFLLAGEDPLNALKILKPYLHRVHLKDRTYKEIDGSPMQVSIDNKETFVTTLGEGDCNISAIIKEVKSCYKNMDFVIEFDFAKLNITDNVINSATFYFTENT